MEAGIGLISYGPLATKFDGVDEEMIASSFRFGLNQAPLRFSLNYHF